jgi:hypothetical protein
METIMTGTCRVIHAVPRLRRWGITAHLAAANGQVPAMTVCVERLNDLNIFEHIHVH